MSQDKHEQEFEDYLQGDSELSTGYRHLSSEQAPPGHLDDAILAASRRQVKAKPGYVFSPFSSNWQKPLSLAAVLVLSVTIIVTLQNDDEDIHLRKPALQQSSPQPQQSADNRLSDRADNDMQTDEPGMDEMEVMSELSVESDFAEQASFATPSTAMKREKSMTLESVNVVSKEKMMSSSRQRLKVMSDMPAPTRALEKPFAAVSEELTESIQKDQFNAPARKAINAKSRMKSEAVEFVSKRNFEAKSETNRRLENASSAASAASKGSSIDASLAVAADTALPADSGAEEWLSKIEKLWHNGEEQAALSQMRLFREKNPNYNENKLLDVLPLELLELSKKQH